MRERRVHSVSTPTQIPVRLNLSLYDASLLRDEVAVEIAIGDLESNLAKTTSVDGIIEDLMADPCLLEFALANVSDTAARYLTRGILDALPTEMKLFSTSLGCRVLQRLCLFLAFFSYPSSSDKPADIDEEHRSIQRAKRGLHILAQHSFEKTESAVKGSSSKKKKAKQRQPPSPPRPAIDSKVFDDLGIAIPSDQNEALAVGASMIDQQKRLLEHYLRVLRYPQLREAITQTYVVKSKVSDASLSDASASQTDLSQADRSARVDATTEETAQAYPFVQPIKAALYFDSAEGFGDWRILISTAANTDLRKMRKKSSALFKITLKKIKELSLGHFSPDNQKALTENGAIPIYEAKMTGDSRLVYQIDCVPEFETNVERQVIRVFGIYTHAQLNRQPWDSISNQLGRKGRQYRSRCVPALVGGQAGVALPQSWPAQAEADPTASSEDSTTSSEALSLPDLRKDDLDKHVFDVSIQEKDIIEYPRSCYVLGRSGTGKTTTMLFKMLGIERSWQACEGVLAKPRQIFVTQSRVLAEKVQEYFAKLHGSLLVADKSPQELKSLKAQREVKRDLLQALVDQDEEVQFRGDLPRCFSELTDEHFPMFVTYDQLCRLLEADFPPSESSSASQKLLGLALTDTSADVVNDVLSNDYMQQRRDSFVTYKVFLKLYWTHFPQALAKNIDPALVFAEIMGVIKGSEQSLTSEHGFLDRDSYLNLSYRTQATFANQRDVVYDLFLAYLKQKRIRGEWDAADRYVDEAQDNLLIDALVLRSMCRNADTGLFWAGDTAQTISIGSAFRFNDLKAFLYRIELSNDSCANSGSQPRTFQLAINYRSHAGIVNCAHSIIELITMFWPYSIDHLAPERGVIEGGKPVFLSRWDEDAVRYEQFLFGDSSGHLEFGAQQCILVRDDAARQRLRAQVGDIGLILTIYECKGLEYNDVLLYNFFADSTVELSQWRVILNALAVDETAALRAPRFDDSRYNGVCRDLKFLYVAITRARKNLWIADTSEKCEPMRHFLAAKGLIQVCTPASSVPQLATSSTPEEWAETARTLFNNRQYLQAMHCYGRAKLFRDHAVSEAYYLREQARTTQTDSRGDDAARIVAFRKAAEAFRKSGSEADSAREKRAYFRISAECFQRSNDLFRAAQAYKDAEEYDKSASLYRQDGSFDDALDIIERYRDSMDQRVVTSITDVSCLVYLRNRNIKQARSLFPSDAAALEYMSNRGLDIARAMLLEQLGRLSDAAQVHLEEGRTAKAISLLLKDLGSTDAAARASRCLLDGLGRRLSFGVSPASDVSKADAILQDLCGILNSPELEIAKLDDRTRDELLMFRAIVANDASELLKLGEHFHIWHKDIASSLRCLDHAFMAIPKLRVASLREIAETLRHFNVYVALLHRYASAADLCEDEGIQRLFAFKMATDDFFLIPNDTFLFARCAHRLSQGSRQSDEGALVLRTELDRLLRHALQERLYTKIREENEECHMTRALQVCLPYFTTGRCLRAECHKDHVAAEGYDVESYNLRIRVHLQQILIYNSAHAVESRSEQAKQHRAWLRQLHEALNPPLFKMGTVYSLRPLMIPEYNSAIHIVKKWILDWLYDLRSFGNRGDLISTFLTALMRTISLGLTFNSSALQHHLIQVPSVAAGSGPNKLLRSKADTQVYIVHDLTRYVYNAQPSSLASGINFINHVLMNRLFIDVTVLCELLDNLCALIVVASRLQTSDTLHDITMPRSWLQRALLDIHQMKDKFLSRGFLEMYMAPMAGLLEQIYTSDAGHLLYGGGDLSSLGWHVKNVFLSRLNLCVLGYNSRFPWLRIDIHRTITSLQRPGRDFNRVYQYYVTAPNWNSLARELCAHSTSGSNFDEMVQLYHASTGQPRAPPPWNMRRVVYRDVREIAGLLTSGAAAVPKTLNLRSDATPFIPIQVHTPAQAEDSPAAALEPDDGRDDKQEEVDEEEDAEIADAAVDDNDDTLALDGQDPAAVQLAQEKLDAARVLADAYLRARRKKSTASTSPAVTIHLRFANAYRAACHWDETMERSQKCYHVRVLVDLPHGMAFLELARNHLHETKSRLKKRHRTVNHLELEKVGTEMTQCIEQFDEAIRLIKALQPGAGMHERRDMEELKARVREVEQFAESLPPRVTTEWDFYLKTAVDGILKPRPRPAKKPKPELNMADDDMMDYDDDEWSDGE
ncbi:hypothetical protein EVJ58_g8968 [Rhodofomes roseus]|uniref:UvrD-like helicase ATP-binding domain-containing protein n=1 Tax=Rhodofomes roseus TaxID=34475 RepID=A0A4Y9XXV5_9APHY|nr:hypothetical protein EVJ58_g8968 [Rhodofomes roseus]